MDWVVLLRGHGLGKGTWNTSGLRGWLMKTSCRHGEYSHSVVRLPTCYILVVLCHSLRDMANANKRPVHMGAVFLSGLRSSKQEQR